MVPWADVSDGGNQLRCTSYCTLGKLHFRQIAQIAAHKLAADKSVDSLQIQYTIDQDQRSAMQIVNQEHMGQPKCMTKCILKSQCEHLNIDYRSCMWRVKIMCPNMYTKWPNGCGLRTCDSAWSNPKVLLISNVKRNRVRWNLKFYYQNQDQNSFYSLWNLFNVSLSVQREANKLCIFLDYWFFISFLILFIYLLWCKCLHAARIGVESVREQ